MKKILVVILVFTVLCACNVNFGGRKGTGIHPSRSSEISKERGAFICEYAVDSVVQIDSIIFKFKEAFAEYRYVFFNDGDEPYLLPSVEVVLVYDDEYNFLDQGYGETWQLENQDYYGFRLYPRTLKIKTIIKEYDSISCLRDTVQFYINRIDTIEGNERITLTPVDSFPVVRKK